MGKLKYKIQSGFIFVQRHETREEELFQQKWLNGKPSAQK